jgi:drug/metabolite transporter (DMT)-like permease
MAGRRAAALSAVNLAAVLFGSTALFGKLPVSPVWIVGGRAAFAAAALFVIVLVQRRKAAWRVPFKGALMTGMLLALHWVSFFAAVQWANVAIATLTFATFPLFTIAFQAVMRRRIPSGIEFGAGLAIVIGVALIAGPGLPTAPRAQMGVIVGIVSAASFALFGLVSQALTRTGDPVRLSLVQNLIVALFLVPNLLFAAPMPLTGRDWLLIALLGVVATAGSHQLYFYALKRLPAAVCGAFVSLEPVYAILFAAVMFGEPLGLAVIASAALIVAASMLLLRRTEPEFAAP